MHIQYVRSVYTVYINIICIYIYLFIVLYYIILYYILLYYFLLYYILYIYYLFYISYIIYYIYYIYHILYIIYIYIYTLISVRVYICVYKHTHSLFLWRFHAAYRQFSGARCCWPERSDREERRGRGQRPEYERGKEDNYPAMLIWTWKITRAWGDHGRSHERGAIRKHGEPLDS